MAPISSTCPDPAYSPAISTLLAAMKKKRSFASRRKQQPCGARGRPQHRERRGLARIVAIEDVLRVARVLVREDEGLMLRRYLKLFLGSLSSFFEIPRDLAELRSE